MISGQSAIQASLASTEEALVSFSRAVEGEFLELGTTLRNMATDAQKMEALSGIVVTATSGSAEDAAIQFAFQLLKKAEDLVRATREQYDYVLAVFKQLQRDLQAMARERNTLNWILTPFKLTKMQFRLQACAFDAETRAQFSTVSETIGNIISEIEAAVDHRFLELEQNAQSAESLALRLNGLSLQQNQRTNSMLQQARMKLLGLNAALESSRALALSMRERGATTRNGVTKAVMALQCQDIVRQKLEHICVAMKEMRDHLASSGDEPDYAYLSEVAELQRAHAESAFEQLNAAGERIRQGLCDVQQNATRLAEQAVQTGSATLDGKVINLTIASIQEVLTLMSDAVTHVRGVLELVQQLNGEFSKCTSQVMPLTRRLRMMAMNAQISATKVNAAKVLEIVAQTTRTVSEEANEQLLAISTRVSAVIEAVTNLSARLSDYCDVASAERGVLTADAETARQKLETLERDLRGALDGIGQVNERLARNADTASNIRFPTLLAEVRTRASTALEAAANASADRGGETAWGGRVAALKRHYTMADEHAVHARATGTELRSPTVKNSGGTDTDSNIELF